MKPGDVAQCRGDEHMFDPRGLTDSTRCACGRLSWADYRARFLLPDPRR